MKLPKILALSLLGLFLFSCGGTWSISDTNTKSLSLSLDLFEGHWEFMPPNGMDASFTLGRIDSLKQDEEGISFSSDGKLIRRQNAGWCGTPPITYGNFDGIWKQISDTSVSIRYDYWGGQMEEDWRVVSVDENKLVLNRLGFRVIEDKK